MYPPLANSLFNRFTIHQLNHSTSPELRGDENNLSSLDKHRMVKDSKLLTQHFFDKFICDKFACIAPNHPLTRLSPFSFNQTHPFFQTVSALLKKNNLDQIFQKLFDKSNGSFESWYQGTVATWRKPIQFVALVGNSAWNIFLSNPLNLTDLIHYHFNGAIEKELITERIAELTSKQSKTHSSLDIFIRCSPDCEFTHLYHLAKQASFLLNVDHNATSTAIDVIDPMNVVVKFDLDGTKGKLLFSSICPQMNTYESIGLLLGSSKFSFDPTAPFPSLQVDNEAPLAELNKQQPPKLSCTYFDDLQRGEITTIGLNCSVSQIFMDWLLENYRPTLRADYQAWINFIFEGNKTLDLHYEPKIYQRMNLEMPANLPIKGFQNYLLLNGLPIPENINDFIKSIKTSGMPDQEIFHLIFIFLMTKKKMDQAKDEGAQPKDAIQFLLRLSASLFFHYSSDNSVNVDLFLKQLWTMLSCELSPLPNESLEYAIFNAIQIKQIPCSHVLTIFSALAPFYYNQKFKAGSIIIPTPILIQLNFNSTSYLNLLADLLNENEEIIPLFIELKEKLQSDKYNHQFRDMLALTGTKELFFSEGLYKMSQHDNGLIVGIAVELALILPSNSFERHPVLHYNSPIPLFSLVPKLFLEPEKNQSVLKKLYRRANSVKILFNQSVVSDPTPKDWATLLFKIGTNESKAIALELVGPETLKEIEIAYLRSINPLKAILKYDPDTLSAEESLQVIQLCHLLKEDQLFTDDELTRLMKLFEKVTTFKAGKINKQLYIFFIKFILKYVERFPTSFDESHTLLFFLSKNWDVDFNYFLNQQLVDQLTLFLLDKNHSFKYSAVKKKQLAIDLIQGLKLQTYNLNPAIIDDAYFSCNNEEAFRMMEDPFLSNEKKSNWAAVEIEKFLSLTSHKEPTYLQWIKVITFATKWCQLDKIQVQSLWSNLLNSKKEDVIVSCWDMISTVSEGSIWEEVITANQTIRNDFLKLYILDKQTGISKELLTQFACSEIMSIIQTLSSMKIKSKLDPKIQGMRQKLLKLIKNYANHIIKLDQNAILNHIKSHKQLEFIKKEVQAIFAEANQAKMKKNLQANQDGKFVNTMISTNYFQTCNSFIQEAEPISLDELENLISSELDNLKIKKQQILDNLDSTNNHQNFFSAVVSYERILCSLDQVLFIQPKESLTQTIIGQLPKRKLAFGEIFDLIFNLHRDCLKLMFNYFDEIKGTKGINENDKDPFQRQGENEYSIYKDPRKNKRNALWIEKQKSTFIDQLLNIQSKKDHPSDDSTQTIINLIFVAANGFLEDSATKDATTDRLDSDVFWTKVVMKSLDLLLPKISNEKRILPIKQLAYKIISIFHRPNINREFYNLTSTEMAALLLDNLTLLINDYKPVATQRSFEHLLELHSARSCSTNERIVKADNFYEIFNSIAMRAAVFPELDLLHKMYRSFLYDDSENSKSDYIKLANCLFEHIKTSLEIEQLTTNFTHLNKLTEIYGKCLIHYIFKTKDIKVKHEENGKLLFNSLLKHQYRNIIAKTRENPDLLTSINQIEYLLTNQLLFKAFSNYFIRFSTAEKEQAFQTIQEITTELYRIGLETNNFSHLIVLLMEVRSSIHFETIRSQCQFIDEALKRLIESKRNLTDQDLFLTENLDILYYSLGKHEQKDYHTKYDLTYSVCSLFSKLNLPNIFQPYWKSATEFYDLHEENDRSSVAFVSYMNNLLDQMKNEKNVILSEFTSRFFWHAFSRIHKNPFNQILNDFDLWIDFLSQYDELSFLLRLLVFSIKTKNNPRFDSKILTDLKALVGHYCNWIDQASDSSSKIYVISTEVLFHFILSLKKEEIHIFNKEIIKFLGKDKIIDLLSENKLLVQKYKATVLSNHEIQTEHHQRILFHEETQALSEAASNQIQLENRLIDSELSKKFIDEHKDIFSEMVRKKINESEQIQAQSNSLVEDLPFLVTFEKILFACEKLITKSSEGGLLVDEYLQIQKELHNSFFLVTMIAPERFLAFFFTYLTLLTTPDKEGSEDDDQDFEHESLLTISSHDSPNSVYRPISFIQKIKRDILINLIDNLAKSNQANNDSYMKLNKILCFAGDQFLIETKLKINNSQSYETYLFWEEVIKTFNKNVSSKVDNKSTHNIIKLNQFSLFHILFPEKDDSDFYEISEELRVTEMLNIISKLNLWGTPLAIAQATHHLGLVKSHMKTKPNIMDTESFLALFESIAQKCIEFDTFIYNKLTLLGNLYFNFITLHKNLNHPISIDSYKRILLCLINNSLIAINKNLKSDFYLNDYTEVFLINYTDLNTCDCSCLIDEKATVAALPIIIKDTKSKIDKSVSKESSLNCYSALSSQIITWALSTLFFKHYSFFSSEDKENFKQIVDFHLIIGDKINHYNHFIIQSIIFYTFIDAERDQELVEWFLLKIGQLLDKLDTIDKEQGELLKAVKILMLEKTKSQVSLGDLMEIFYLFEMHSFRKNSCFYYIEKMNKENLFNRLDNQNIENRIIARQFVNELIPKLKSNPNQILFAILLTINQGYLIANDKDGCATLEQWLKQINDQDCPKVCKKVIQLHFELKAPDLKITNAHKKKIILSFNQYSSFLKTTENINDKNQIQVFSYVLLMLQNLSRTESKKLINQLIRMIGHEKYKNICSFYEKYYRIGLEILNQS